MSSIIQAAMEAVQILVKDNCIPELVSISNPGSSGARVSIIKHPRTDYIYAVKCAKSSRVSLIREIERQRIIQPYLKNHLPKILFIRQIGDYEVMISECKGKHTLHSLIVNSLVSHDKVLQIWHEATSSLLNMWMKNKQYPFIEELCPRYYKARCERIVEGVCRSVIGNIEVGNCLSMPLVINGVNYPSLSEILTQIKLVDNPHFGIMCHGDPQPSNVIVGRDYDWYLVDWEWSGRYHDWRMMISHLFGWWPTRCLVLLKGPQVNIQDNRIYIDYSMVLPSYVTNFQTEARRLYQTMTSAELAEKDAETINRYLAALYFGELRFLSIWGRESFAALFLAEAVKICSYLAKKTKIDNNWFVFDDLEGG